jgi:hypothetical protein
MWGVALREALNDDDPSVRYTGGKALEKIEAKNTGDLRSSTDQ